MPPSGSPGLTVMHRAYRRRCRGVLIGLWKTCKKQNKKQLTHKTHSEEHIQRTNSRRVGALRLFSTVQGKTKETQRSGAHNVTLGHRKEGEVHGYGI